MGKFFDDVGFLGDTEAVCAFSRAPTSFHRTAAQPVIDQQAPALALRPKGRPAFSMGAGPRQLRAQGARNVLVEDGLE